jgi:hypothetical protein
VLLSNKIRDFSPQLVLQLLNVSGLLLEFCFFCQNQVSQHVMMFVLVAGSTSVVSRCKILNGDGLDAFGER